MLKVVNIAMPAMDVTGSHTSVTSLSFLSHLQS